MFVRQIPVADLDQLGPRELTEHLHRLDLERRRIEADLARTMHRATAISAHLADGHQTPAAWGRATNRWSTADATERIRLARLAGEHPSVTDALDDGTLGVAQALVLARARTNPRCGDQLGDYLAIFLDLADKVSYAQFVTAVRRWEMLCDQDGGHRAADAAHRARTAHLTQHDDGSVTFHAEGDALSGAQIREVFDRYVDAEFRADWDACVAEHGRAACSALLRRTTAQRRFDALVAICRDAASTPPDAQPPEPIVHLIADIHTVEEFLEQQGDAEPSPDRDRHRHRDRPTAPPLASRAAPWRRCETRDGQPVPTADVIAAMIIGRIRVHVVDDHGVILRSGRLRRLFTGAQRTAVLLANPTCIWPGCDRPSRDCQADHLTDHQHGGATDVDNGAPLCGHHNHTKNLGYRTWRDAAGHWHTQRPDGTEI